MGITLIFFSVLLFGFGIWCYHSTLRIALILTGIAPLLRYLIGIYACIAWVVPIQHDVEVMNNEISVLIFGILVCIQIGVLIALGIVFRRAWREEHKRTLATLPA